MESLLNFTKLCLDRTWKREEMRCHLEIVCLEKDPAYIDVLLLCQLEWVKSLSSTSEMFGISWCKYIYIFIYISHIEDGMMIDDRYTHNTFQQWHHVKQVLLHVCFIHMYIYIFTSAAINLPFLFEWLHFVLWFKAKHRPFSPSNLRPVAGL